MTNLLMAGASRFAHLAGLRFLAAGDDADGGDKAKKSRATADDDDDDDGMDEGDAKKSKSKANAADDDDDGMDGDEPKSKRGKAKAAADDDADGEADDEPKSKRGKAKAAADDDEDDDEDDDKKEMSGTGPRAAARRRERARCAAIFAHPAAGGNPALAASLAFETSLSRSAAIAVMSSQPKTMGTTVRTPRGAANPQLGTDGAPPKTAASWDRSLAKLGLTPRR